MGDFNYRELNWSELEVVDSSHPFVNPVAENLLSQHVHEPTRGESYLDLVLTSNNIDIHSLKVGEHFETSDHQFVTFQLVVETKVTKCKAIKYNYFKGNYMKSRDLMAAVDWDVLGTGWLKIK